MDKPNKAKSIPSTIILYGGTEVKSTPINLKKLCRHYGIHYDKLYRLLVFDWTKNPVGSGQTTLDTDLITNDEFVPAVMSFNPDVLIDAEKQGYFWAVDEDFHRSPGSAEDDKGAGGKSRVGYVLAAANKGPLCTLLKKLIQAVQDYTRTLDISANGDTSEDGGRIPFSVVISTVGAMGTGSLVWFLNNGIATCAQQTGVKAKTTVHLLMRGNFDTQNPEMARLHEWMTLKYLQTVASGKYVDPFTGRILPIPFTNCCLYSNVNDHGNFTIFPQLLHHQAHAEFFRWATPAGARMRERACDIEGITYNEYGDPLCGQTFGVSMITRPNERVIRFCVLMTSALFCDQLRAESCDNDYAQEAVALAQHEKLIESEDQNLLTGDLIRPQELNHENLINQAQETLLARVGDSWGLRKVLQLDEVISDLLNNEIESFYIPAMKKQAQLRLETVQNRIGELLTQILQKPGGIVEGLQRFYVFRQLLEGFQKMLQTKTVQLQEYLAPHQMILAEASEQAAQLQQRNPIVRWFSLFLIRRIRLSLKKSGIAAIAHQLELSCCNIAEQDVIVPLLDLLDKKIAWLSSTLRKISNIAQSCKARASKLAAEDTTCENPNGIELTKPSYLENYLDQYIRQQGGLAVFKNQLHSAFLNTYGSLDIIIKTPQVELEQLIEKLYEPIFKPIVQSTNVWQEFQATYPNPHTQQEMIAQLIKHSEGRVISEDSVGQNIVWVKAANVPDASCVGPVRDLLQSLDKKGGTWEVLPHTDRDSLVIGQIRGAISLSPFIRRLNIPDNPIGWKAAAEHAVDVVSAVMIPPNPSLRQFRRVLAKAIATDLLVCKEKYFYLECFSAEPLNLGSDFISVKNILIKRWPDLVFIESTYARDLIVDEKVILCRVEDLLNTEDPRSALIDQTAVHECDVQTNIILPRLRRMRVWAMREDQL